MNATFTLHQSDGDASYDGDLSLKHELRDAAKDRRGSSNLPFLVERNETQSKQHEKDKFQRQLQRGASQFLRDMLQARYQRQSTRVLGENQLTKAIIVDALSGLGKHPLSGKHALLELNLKVIDLAIYTPQSVL